MVHLLSIFNMLKNKQSTCGSRWISHVFCSLLSHSNLMMPNTCQPSVIQKKGVEQPHSLYAFIEENELTHHITKGGKAGDFNTPNPKHVVMKINSKFSVKVITKESLRLAVIQCGMLIGSVEHFARWTPSPERVGNFCKVDSRFGGDTPRSGKNSSF